MAEEKNWSCQTEFDDLRPWGGAELEAMACYADVGKEPS